VITETNVLVLLAMLVGTAGVVLPVLPGLAVVWGAVAVWALLLREPVGWVVLAVATLVLAGGLLAKYLVPGRRMTTAGVDATIVAVAAVVAVVGFFVVPVVGAPLGFVLTVYLLELLKHREHTVARRATGQAVRAVVLSMGIELLTALGIITTWAVGVYATRP
jgi:uncharacterized protein YqgC (DUF456 family)